LERSVGFGPGAAGGGFDNEFKQSLEIVEPAENLMDGMKMFFFAEDTLMPAHIFLTDHAYKIMKRVFMMVKRFLMGAVAGNDAGLSGIKAKPGPGKDEIGKPSDLDEDFGQRVEMSGGRRRIFR
jgi:hypothetical protein